MTPQTTPTARPRTMREAALQLLKAGEPMTAAAMAAVLQLNRHSLGTMLGSLHKREPGTLHIADYQRSLGTRGPYLPMWAYGPGDDATPPAPIKCRAHLRAMRAKQRAAARAAEAAPRQASKPLGAIGHLVFALTRPALRTPTELLQALRQAGAAPAPRAREGEGTPERGALKRSVLEALAQPRTSAELEALLGPKAPKCLGNLVLRREARRVEGSRPPVYLSRLAAHQARTAEAAHG